MVLFRDKICIPSLLKVQLDQNLNGGIILHLPCIFLHI